MEDRRGMGGLAAGGGLGAVVLALVVMLMGGDPEEVLRTGGGAERQTAATGAAGDERAEFVRVVLADTEEVWDSIFQARFGRDYPEPTLVLFSGATTSGCGHAQGAMGPFYCPLDRNVYIDLAFYEELQSRLGAPGDFAQAYVIAHEVGHHIQTLTGISEEVHAARQRLPEREANELSVRQELQADCFAGVWASAADEMWGVLERGDVEEALGAAAAVGDDRLQSRSGGRVVPESFTHGTSAQRMEWFQRGFESGDPDRCDTFGSSVG